LHDGQPVGRTDEEGRILVPALRPFEDNTISVVPEDIPLTAMVDSNQITVRPYSHGVVSALVSVVASESRVFTLRLGTAVDEVVPPGAEVALDGHTYPVGTQGLSQLPVAQTAADALVVWPGGRCRIHLPVASMARRAGAGPLGIECRRP
jgi:outer membrane usher protein